MEKIQKNGYVELVADEGKTLTSKSDEERNFAHKVSTYNPELWEEWTDEQAEQWQAEHPQEEEFEELENKIEPLSQDEL